MYKPKLPFNAPFFLLKPTSKTVKGVETKVLPEKGELIFCAFRTFGGTEKTVNGVTVVENTGVIETYYRPDITADCVLMSAATKQKYEILGTPENIEMMNKYLKFKIRATKGGA